MKKIILFLLIGTFAFGLRAQSEDGAQSAEIKWMSFEEAVEASKSQSKKFFIDVYTDWCGWCKRMDKDTYTHPIIVELINEYYWPVKLDAEMKETVKVFGQEFVNEFPDKRRNPHQLAIALLNGKMSYPSVVYLDEKGNMIKAIPGYQKPDGMEPILNFFAEDAHLKEGADLNTYQKKFVSKLK